LVDLAAPAFENVGKKSPKRQAFWYRRTFIIDAPIPAVARLKVYKAMFGAKVILNGKELGEQRVTFTAQYFNVKDVLREGENEIIIRVGAHIMDVDLRNALGWDEEKAWYIPGVFDSVELILTGAEHVERVQAAPDIGKKSVTVHAYPRQPARFTVREYKSKKVIGEAQGDGKATIVIPDCRLWSPEDPFLYEVTVRTAGDELTSRFGMRSFRLDPQTGWAMLNGKPYFLRGSNVTLYRFFEDSERGNLPWREEWVRALHRRFKDMHWNALRYCIGQPPEMWFRIADEEGFLIQDEYPIWGWNPKATNVGELAGFLRDQMQQHWNYPSVVIWDTCNETNTPETGTTLEKVRGLDLSDRPWDNGWGPRMRPTDAREDHRYNYGEPDRTLEWLQRSYRQWNHKPGDPAVIINEYGWLWLNRDGTPTTLTKQLYENLLGPNNTTEQRRTLYARYLAADTEFWRASRGAAGVLHFVALGYSRANGQTSDHWMPGGVERLEWEPLFYKYVRDAFAPVGVSVGNFEIEQLVGQSVTYPIEVINDLDKPWQGRVRVQLHRDGKMIVEKTMPVSVDAWGKTELAFPVTMPTEAGTGFGVTATLLDTPAGPVSSLRDFSLLTPEQLLARNGIAWKKPAKASAREDHAGHVTDGALLTDWDPGLKQKATFPQWVAVDLQAERTVSRVETVWKTNNIFPRQFQLQVSGDGQTWREVTQPLAAQGGVQSFTFAPVKARWVRCLVLQGAAKDPWGSGIYLRELRVFEK
jgi:beta-galactosidase